MLIQQKIMMSCSRADEETYLIHVGDRLSVKLIQIQKIIVVYVLEGNCVIDSFWLNWQSHIKKKLHNTYILKDLKTEELHKIFEARIVKHLSPKSDLFLRAIYNNLITFNRLLTHKDFKNVAISSVKMYRAINQQPEYKMLYEERWGKTGFDLEEKNWIIAYRKKCKKQ